MLRIVEFKTEYRVGRDPIDKVLIAPLGAATEKTQTWHRVLKMKPPENVDDRMLNSDHYRDMVEKWKIIGPAYEAWKAGTELPVDGTPLAAWAGVTPEQARFLNAMGLRTVESVRDMGDKEIEALRWPNARQLPKMAADYLKGADAAAKDAEIAALRERMDAMNALLEEQAAAQPKRGPGRPKKSEVEAA